MENALVKLIGWRATVLHGDPSVYDRWKWVRRYLLPGTVRTLDAGCGSGSLTMYAAKIGNRSVGIDFNHRRIQVARNRLRMLGITHAEFILADLRTLGNLAAELGTFDQIICVETIEHIADDEKLLKDLALVLKPGGRLLLTTPYKLYKPLLYDKLSETEDGGHVRWGYTHDEMRRLLEGCGISILVEEYISGVVTQQLVNLHRLFGRYGKLGWALTFPLRLLQFFDTPLTKITRWIQPRSATLDRKASAGVRNLRTRRGR